MTDVMAELAADAQQYKPRLFAIFGRRKSVDHEFLGWGMDFEALGNTLYYQPASRTTHTSESPGQILALYRRISTDARLEWLDPK